MLINLADRKMAISFWLQGPYGIVFHLPDGTWMRYSRGPWVGRGSLYHIELWFGPELVPPDEYPCSPYDYPYVGAGTIKIALNEAVVYEGKRGQVQELAGRKYPKVRHIFIPGGKT